MIISLKYHILAIQSFAIQESYTYCIHPMFKCYQKQHVRVKSGSDDLDNQGHLGHLFVGQVEYLYSYNGSMIE